MGPRAGATKKCRIFGRGSKACGQYGYSGDSDLLHAANCHRDEDMQAWLDGSTFGKLHRFVFSERMVTRLIQTAVMPTLNSDYLALLSLLASLVAIAVTFIPVLRDHPKIEARRSFVQDTPGTQEYNLIVSVSNKGRRPITISFVLARRPGEPGKVFPFSPSGSAYLQNNGAASALVRADQCGWRTSGEATNFEVFVIDSTSRQYRVS